MTNKPAFEVRDGTVKVTVWKNDSENGIFYSADLVRSWRDDDGQWHEKKGSLSGGDMLRGANLLHQAYNRILELKAADVA